VRIKDILRFIGSSVAAGGACLSPTLVCLPQYHSHLTLKVPHGSWHPEVLTAAPLTTVERALWYDLGVRP
jgi:hypothetical protein